MTIWCNTCRSPVNAPCISHHEDHQHSFCRRSRSTKGASKARRDHINHEIRNMRALLPITLEDQERLSYLHSMAAICAYIRKSVLFQELPNEERLQCSLPYEAFLQALHGFILVTTAQGRLVYVSENVAEYLGLSMVDVLQGDTFYDIVEGSDFDVVKSNLKRHGGNSSSLERSFICCMQTSRAFKLQHGSCCSMLVRGSFQHFPQPFPSSRPDAEPLFVSLCTPTVNRLRGTDSLVCHSFRSIHRLDMTFTQLSDSVLYLLGYSAEDMAGRSWYGLVHPEDLSTCASSHRSLMHADEGLQVEMVLRLQCKDLSWTWVYIRANKESECRGISCVNFIISETEARFLQTKVSSDAFSPSSLANSGHFAAQQAPQTQSYNTKCFKRQRTSNSQSEEQCAKSRRESEQDIHTVAFASSQGDCSPVPLRDSPALFTPPYSPAFSSSPLQQDELSHDLLMDAHGYTEQLPSSPESSPSYYSYPETALTCYLSPSDSLPGPAEQTFGQAAFGTLNALSPISSSSPTYDFPACTSDARLVPDCLSVSDMCESPVDCALHQDDFGLLEQPQGGSLHQVHLVPQHVSPVRSSLLTPNQSPPSMASDQYNDREQAEISILAQQISSLASSFDMYHNLSPLQATTTLSSFCDWPHHPPLPSVLPLKRNLVLDDGTFDSLLKDLDMVTRKNSCVAPYIYQQDSVCSRSGSEQLDHEPLGLSPTITGSSLPAGGAAMEPFTFQSGCHDQNNGLHQLSHYMQSSLQQDGLAEENLV